MKGCEINKLRYLIALSIVITTQTKASDFSLPFVNTSQMGSAYSGWAAEAEDASTAYSNPAGLTRINQNQQLVVSGIGLLGRTVFHGTTTTPPFPPASPEFGHARSMLKGLLPGFHYSYPFSPKIVFAFSSTIPFALGTNYSKTSVVRYAATRSKIVVFDFSPSVGVKLTDQISFGIGFDLERINFKIDSMFGEPLASPDVRGNNHLRGYGYSLHTGLLYELNQCTRFGLSYNAQTVFHTHGLSKVTGGVQGNFRTNDQRSTATLPSLANFSAYHDINPQWTVMGTVFYTRWSVLQNLTLRHTILPHGIRTSVTIPFKYHDTYDVSLGAKYKLNDQFTLTTGIEFLDKPSKTRNRSLPDPIGGATIIAFGAHYTQNRCFEYDLGYEHTFFNRTGIHLSTPLTTANGHSNQGTNLLGLQMTWNII